MGSPRKDAIFGNRKLVDIAGESPAEILESDFIERFRPERLAEHVLGPFHIGFGECWVPLQTTV